MKTWAGLDTHYALGIAREITEHQGNAAREAAVEKILTRRSGLAGFGQQSFRAKDGQRRKNFWVDAGHADRHLVLIAHHDAVDQSPGANDNAASIGILLSVLDALPPLLGMRVRCLFTAEEERGLQGAYAYVDQCRSEKTIGILSLELCGIGDQIVIWDDRETNPFLQRVQDASDAHRFGVVGGFSSDHRAFAFNHAHAYGFSVASSAHLHDLTRFIATRPPGMVPPPPMTTYHTPNDNMDTLERSALQLAGDALLNIITAL